MRRDTTGTTLYLPGQEVRRQGTVSTGTRYYSFAGTPFTCLITPFGAARSIETAARYLPEPH